MGRIWIQVRSVSVYAACIHCSAQTATDLRDKLDGANIAVEYFGSFDSDGNPSQQLRVIKVQ